MSAFSLDGCTGCIFDCDGTLLDSMPAWNRLESDLAAMAGLTLTDEQLEELRAAPLEEGLKIFHYRYGLGESPEDVGRIIDEALLDFYRTQAEALPGARELLERCREAGIPCVVVTSSPQRYVAVGLERAGLAEFVKRVITTDDAGFSKQDPRIWHLALEELGSDAATTWGFEDAIYAIRVMNQVGIRTVGAYDCDETGTFEQLQAEADLAVRSLEELL